MTTKEIRDEALETMLGKVEVIDRMDGEIVDRIAAAEASRRLAACHNGGDDAAQRAYQRGLEAGQIYATPGFFYRLSKECA